MANGLVPNIGQQLRGGVQTLAGLQQMQLQRQQTAAQTARQQQLQQLLGQVQPQQPVQTAAPIDPQAAALTGQPAPQTQQPAPAAQPVQRPSAQAMAQLAVQFPEQFEQINKNLGLIDEQRKTEAADFAFKLSRTPFEGRQALIDERVSNLAAQGRDASDTASLAELSQEQQDQALEAVQLAALTPEQRLNVAQGADLGSQIQRAQFIEGEGFAGLTKSGQVIFRQLPDDVRQRIRANKQQELTDKIAAEEAAPIKLSSALEKRLTASVDAAAAAQSSANELDALAVQFEQEQPSAGVFGGTVIESLKDFTGSQDAVSLMRKKFAGIRASQSVKNLPPGPASDKDIQLALSGFPAPNANADFIAQWLRGVAKLERESAQFEDFRSAFISAGGSPDRAKRTFEFDGFTVNKGDRLTNAYRNFRLGKGDSAIVVKDNPRFGNVTEEDITETLRQNPGLTREQLLQQLSEGQ